VAKSSARDAFREGVFARDRHRCVVCGAPAQDAHHLLERRLFADGGYVLDNGVSLCNPHHREAEATTLSCESLRAAAGIERVVLPPQLYEGRRYDKWGDPVRGDDRRLRGELFFEEPVQKALAPLLRLFVPRIEVPRAPHLSGSAGAPGFVIDAEAVGDGEVVVLGDPDGEVIAVDAEGLYVGTGEAIEASGMGELPRLVGELVPGGRVSGIRRGEEFVVTAAWDGRDVCLAWDDTALLAEMLELPVAPTLARGRFTEAELRALAGALGDHRVRRAEGFAFAAHRRCVGRVEVAR
jgi:hypothetical protein